MAKEANTEKTGYGVSDIAEELGVDAKVVRQGLRKLGIEKNKDTGTYSWAKKSELNSIVAKLKEAAKTAPAKEKPAKKAPAKKKSDDNDD